MPRHGPQKTAVKRQFRVVLCLGRIIRKETLVSFSVTAPVGDVQRPMTTREYFTRAYYFRERSHVAVENYTRPPEQNKKKGREKSLYRPLGGYRSALYPAAFGHRRRVSPNFEFTTNGV